MAHTARAEPHKPWCSDRRRNLRRLAYCIPESSGIVPMKVNDLTVEIHHLDVDSSELFTPQPAESPFQGICIAPSASALPGRMRIAEVPLRRATFAADLRYGRNAIDHIPTLSRDVATSAMQIRLEPYDLPGADFDLFKISILLNTVDGP
jgi:hypothetical protein